MLFRQVRVHTYFVSSKLAKTGAAKVDNVLEAGEKAAAKHVKTRIEKGKNYINSVSKNKYEPALAGIARAIPASAGSYLFLETELI